MITKTLATLAILILATCSTGQTLPTNSSPPSPPTTTQPPPKIKLEFATSELNRRMHTLGRGELGEPNWKHPRAVDHGEIADFLKRIRWQSPDYPGAEFGLALQGDSNPPFSYKVVANNLPLSAPTDMSIWAEAFKSALREEARKEVEGVDVEKELVLAQRKLSQAFAEMSTKSLSVERAQATETPDSADVNQLTNQKKSLESASMDKKARRMALQVALSEELEQQKLRKIDDPIATELRNLVKIRETALLSSRSLNSSGVGSTADVQAAQAAVSEAKLRLFEREEALSKTGKGELVDRLSNELRMITVDQTQLEIQIRMIDDQLAQHQEKRNQSWAKLRAAAATQAAAKETYQKARADYLRRKALLLLGEADGW